MNDRYYVDVSDHCFPNCSRISMNLKYGYLYQYGRGLVSNFTHQKELMYFSELVYTVRTPENNDKMLCMFHLLQKRCRFPSSVSCVFRSLLPYEETTTCFKKKAHILSQKSDFKLHLFYIYNNPYPNCYSRKN